MASSERGKIQYETGRTAKSNAALTNAGDDQTFTYSGAAVWSNHEDGQPVIRPNGIVSGRNLLSPHADNDKVAVAVHVADSKGIRHTISATTATITRPATNVSRVISVVMTDAGAIDVILGTAGATTAFTETRGAAGGPPLITADYVEIGQIRVTASASAPIEPTEIFQADGIHNERADMPGYTINYLGDGEDAVIPAKKNAYLLMDSALPKDHTGPACKKVYAQVFVPIFSDLSKGVDFTPAELTYSGSSESYYGGATTSTSTSLGQCTFSALVSDGISDGIVRSRNKTVTVKFFPDRNKTPYMMSQGKVGIVRTFPIDAQNRAEVTLTVSQASVDFSS